MQSIIYLNEINIKNNTKAVIFDCFGTLMNINDKQMPYKFLREILYKNNINIEKFSEWAMTKKVDFQSIEELCKFKFSNEEKIKFKQMLEKELRSIHIYPEVNVLLKKLKNNNITTMMCSNLAFPYGNAAKKLTYPLDHYVLSYDIGYIKPNPKIFRECQKRLNLESDDIVYVGDSYKNDYLAAKEYGFDSYWLKRN
jgi:HAD superfamily hydrolase (TIGR01549 family)